MKDGTNIYCNTPPKHDGSSKKTMIKSGIGIGGFIILLLVLWIVMVFLGDLYPDKDFNASILLIQQMLIIIGTTFGILILLGTMWIFIAARRPEEI